MASLESLGAWRASNKRRLNDVCSRPRKTRNASEPKTRIFFVRSVYCALCGRFEPALRFFKGVEDVIHTHAIRRSLMVSAGVVLLTISVAAQNKVRIILTNSAGDSVHVIDPATNKVVGVISGIEVSHGAAVAPDGTRIYISNEADSTLDIVDGKTLTVINKVKLSGHPNNIAIARDGRRVYVGIIQEPGGVDVIDTASLKNVKTIP